MYLYYHYYFKWQKVEMQKKLAIVIPVYNEAAGLLAFLPRLCAELSSNCINTVVAETDVIIVDDGSQQPLHQGLFKNVFIPENVKLHLLRHQINLGPGAAIQTGIEYGRTCLECSVYATMDSDGQHSEKDLLPLLRHLETTQADIVFGNRFGEGTASGIPLSRRILLRAAVVFERYLTGLYLQDAHNGFRVFNSRCAAHIELKLNRMAHATEFKQIVRRNRLKYEEHPVHISYSADSLAKGQRNSGSLVILRDLLKTYLFERL